MQRKNERLVERLPLVLPHPLYAYALAGLFCLIGLGIRIVTAEVVPSGFPFLTFFPAVILSSFLFGVRPGIFAAILGGLLSWYFFIPGGHSFSVNPAVLMVLLFYSGVVAVDITLIHFMQSANFNLAVERERNRVLAENRELLFHELQHRISNNLQVVAAMLSLQRRQVDHDAARRALDDASARLALVGKISRELYDPSGEGRDMQAFLATLAADVVEASGRSDIVVAVSVPGAVQVETHVAVPLALIVAEAIANTIEHGLPDRAGQILISLEEEAGRLVLRVIDDGKGLQPDFRVDGKSLGLRIASALAMQLDGSFALEPAPGGGACARLDLPAPLR